MRLLHKLLFVFLLACVFLVVAPASSATADTAGKEEITSFAADIALHQDGTALVTETIHYDFGPSERHGIFRTIPYIKTNTEGKRFKLDISLQSVRDREKQNYRYSTSRNGEELTIKIGDPNATITGSHTYVLTYVVKGGVTYFSDHDEWYWNATGNKWDVPLRTATVQVHIPLTQPAGEIKGVCYTGFTGSTQQQCVTSVQGNTITYSTPRSFAPGEGLTIVAAFPKGVVAVLEPQEDIPFFSTFLGRIVLIGIILVALWWYVGYPLQIAFMWMQQGRDPVPASGVVSAWFDPPQGKHKRALTPAETGGLVDEKVDLRDIMATVIHLAQRGYFTIEERAKKDFYFIKKTAPVVKERLSAFEQILIDRFFKHGAEFRLKGKHIQDTITQAQNAVYEALMADEFFVKNPQKVRLFYGVILGLASFTINPLLILSSLIFGMHMPRKTLEGAQQAAVGTSLKNFLSSQERTLEHQARTQVFFEKLLPFAVAFGVEKLWAQRFKDLAMQEPDWYHSNTGATFSSIYLSQSLNSSLSQLQSAVTPTSSSSGFSSGFSGGSSGGGGGGGGGGSW